MKKPDSIRSTSNALLALASSVLTDLIYGEISDARYEAHYVSNKIVIEQINQLGFLTRLFVIGIIFFVIWMLLFIIRLALPKLIERLMYRNKRSYTKEQVCLNFISAKSTLLTINHIVREEYDRIGYCSKEIGGAITLLYDTFCPQKRRLERVVKSSFRTGSICDFEQRISPYDYFLIIELAKNLVDKLKNSNPDNMLQSDCQRLDDQLKKLKTEVLQ